jgi:type I restriction enzyme S subunit
VNWPQVSLASVCDKPQYGAIAKGSDQPIGPRFVRQTDIASGRIEWSSVPFCDLPRADFSKYAIKRGDVLISRLGNGVGNAATVRDANDAVFAGYLVRFRAQASEADPEFIGYQLQSGAWRQHVAGFRSGAAQPTLNAQQMGEFQFLLPLMDEQRGIAATLGALDDKIESNRRASDLLQDLSRSLYSIWRHRNHDVANTTFGNFADVFGGATPKTTEPRYWNGGIRWTTPTDITALSAPYLYGTARTISQDGLDSTSAVLHPAVSSDRSNSGRWNHGFLKH